MSFIRILSPSFFFFFFCPLSIVYLFFFCLSKSFLTGLADSFSDKIIIFWIEANEKKKKKKKLFFKKVNNKNKRKKENESMRESAIELFVHSILLSIPFNVRGNSRKYLESPPNVIHRHLRVVGFDFVDFPYL